MPEHYIEGRLKGVAKKYAFQLSLFSSIFIGEQTHPDDNHVILGENVLLYHQVGIILSYRQVDNMSDCRHWNERIEQFRPACPVGDILPSRKAANALDRLQWILAPMTSTTAPCKIII